ncbi:MAG: DUF4411 family protein [Terrimonas sp.]|nr:DUF4411 family protein [Terrimonas sp.]OJY81448.1 MAG: hypothetical protein BGP13_03300 [Sphingobacteriales bacterium 40-81]
MSTPVFIIDTSCLTQAHRVYYPFDIAPSFWGFMEQHFIDGDFIITNKVVDEIKKGKDELASWIQSHLSSKELDCHADASIMTHYASIMSWGNNHAQYNSLAKQEFSDFENADPFIVATALEKSAVVVSQEVSAPNSQKSIKIPDVCKQFNVSHIGTFTLLRRFGFTM